MSSSAPQKRDVCDCTYDELDAAFDSAQEMPPIIVTDPDKKSEQAEPCPIEIVYLNHYPPTPTKWIVNGLIPEESCIVLGAEEKTGKSWFAFLLAICICS